MSFTIATNAREALEAMQALRNANREALRALQPQGNTAAGKMVKTLTIAFADEWEATAPRATGALASATRGEVSQGVGVVFTDPSATNPVSGGRPADYGAIVHQRQPWVADLFTRGGLTNVISREAQAFVDIIGGIYE